MGLNVPAKTLISKSFPDSESRMVDTYIIGCKTQSLFIELRSFRCYFLNSLEKSFAVLSAIFTTIVRAELLEMCLRDQHLGTCACEIISRIARIVQLADTE